MEIKNLIVGPIFTNCYLLTSKDETAVIDPGGGAEKILKEIEDNRKKLKYIILTHSHWDHTSAALKIKGETGAKILIHKAEKDFLNFEVDKFLKEGDKIKIGDIILEVIHTPGHTKGSICLLEKDFIFTGDTLFKTGFGRTDLPGGSSKDLQESLEKLSKLLKPGMKIYPGHGEIFEYKK
ncbi:MBL fold metallo-hydrolase [Patescibacteria group bacterium]|nr:MBL fold metallo-hydrolase [Patescibacteria group bacterium]